MEILNFVEDCEKPAPTLCFDIMEMIGNEYQIIKQKQYLNEHKNMFNELLEGLEVASMEYWIHYNYLTNKLDWRRNGSSKYFEYKHQFIDEDDY